MFNRPCLDCGVLTNTSNRCAIHQGEYQARQDANKKGKREHYKGSYQKRAKIIRDNAVECWICREGYRANDPWTADHLIPGHPGSPLASAHRSCNSRRGARLEPGGPTRGRPQS